MTAERATHLTDCLAEAVHLYACHIEHSDGWKHHRYEATNMRAALVASGVVADPAEVERLKRAAVDARDELDDAHQQLNTLRLDLARKSAEFDALTLRAENGGISDQEIERIGDRAWTAVEDAADRVAAVRAALKDVAALHVDTSLSETPQCKACGWAWPCATLDLLARHGVTAPTPTVLYEVAAERARQDAKWGEQNHPDGTGDVWAFCNGKHAGWAQEAAEDARRRCQEAPQQPWGDTWALILTEEVAEAFAETDPAKLRAELVQVAAVATQWVEAIDRRTAPTEEPQPVVHACPAGDSGVMPCCGRTPFEVPSGERISVGQDQGDVTCHAHGTQKPQP